MIHVDNHPGHSLSYWAQTPKQENKILILDVDGTRLVILASYPPNIFAQDRTDLDAIISSSTSDSPLYAFAVRRATGPIDRPRG